MDTSDYKGWKSKAIMTTTRGFVFHETSNDVHNVHMLVDRQFLSIHKLK